jgi:hypothetical protein
MKTHEVSPSSKFFYAGSPLFCWFKRLTAVIEYLTSRYNKKYKVFHIGIKPGLKLILKESDILHLEDLATKIKSNIQLTWSKTLERPLLSVSHYKIELLRIIIY